MAYGARLESVLGASPHGFESHILRALRKKTFTNETVKKPQRYLGLLSIQKFLVGRLLVLRKCLPKAFLSCGF